MTNSNINVSREYLDKIFTPETLKAMSESSDFRSFLQDAIKKLTEDKKRREKEQEAKAKEEEQSKNKSSGSVASFIRQKVDEYIRKRASNKTTDNGKKSKEESDKDFVFDVLYPIIQMGKERQKKSLSKTKQITDEGKTKKKEESDSYKKNDEAVKRPKGFRKKTNDIEELSKKEALKDNKNFIIDDDGTPKILVQKGDTLSSIIRNQSSSILPKDMQERIDEIVKLNKLKNKDLIIPGQKLKVPNSVLPDVTDFLNKMMRENAKDPRISNISYFVEKVKGNGDWDLKSKPGYTKNDYKYFVYDGEIVKYDALGNIHYGYVAQAIPWTSEKLVYIGAGLYQDWTDLPNVKKIVKKDHSCPLYGDNIDDVGYTKKGIDQYYKDYYDNLFPETNTSDPRYKAARDAFVKWRAYTPVQELFRKHQVHKGLEEEYENHKRETLKPVFDSDDDIVLSN